jgi:hypothetical protein
VNIVGCGKDETDITALTNVKNVLIEGIDGINLVIERICLSLSTISPNSGFVNIKGIDSGLVMIDVKV